MENKMFRYLLKYVGTYRVLPKLNLDGDFPRNSSGGIDDSFDDLYIPCLKGIIQHTSEYCYLMWYTDRIITGRKVKSELERLSVPIHFYEETDQEVLIGFEDKYLSEVASVVKPKTQGKDVSPFSSRNLDKKQSLNYKIPDKDIAQYNDIIKDLSLNDKMQFARNVTKEFDSIIEKHKAKNYNLKEERKQSGYAYKEFIHSIGMWDEFIVFMKKRYDEQFVKR